MKLRVVVFQLYQQFVQRFHNLDQPIESHNDAINHKITDFLIELHKTIGLQSVDPTYIYNYLVFQFNYWNDKKVGFGDRITFNRVFGRKSLERFRQRRNDFSWYNAQLSMSKFGIEPSMINQFSTKKIKNFLTIDSQEELEKARFLNTVEGLRNCIDNTTLYNHRSNNCIICTHNVMCKKLLKQNYIGIYVDRGYDRKTSNKKVLSV